jgi:hypothetical protein
MAPSNRTLRDYQVEGVRFLDEHPHAAVLMDMGLGKTATVLHAMKNMPKPILLIGPISVIENVWRAEAVEWPETSSTTFALLRGSPKVRAQRMAGSEDVHMINPEGLSWLLDQPGWRKYKTLIIDESTNFKNPSSHRFRALRYKLKHFERRVIMTASPAPNGHLDLWAQYFIVDLGERLDTSVTRFRRRYFETTDWNGYVWKIREGAADVIAEKVADISYRVNNPNLGEAIFNTVPLSLDRDARKLYDDMERRALAEFQATTVTAATAAAVLMKLRQGSAGFFYDEDKHAHFIHKEKIEATRRVVDNTSSPVIVLYQFQEDLRRLKAAFPEGKQFGKEINQEEFNKGECPVLFLHPASGGHGVNLQKVCHTMVVYSPAFYEQMSQAIGRIDRQGQTETVVIHYLEVLDTSDRFMLDLYQTRGTDQTNLLTAIKEYANETSHRRRA